MANTRRVAAQGEPSSAAPSLAQRIHEVVGAIPRGCVATYGQVAALAGIPRGHRVAAQALRCCPSGLPWQRVLARKDARRAVISIQEPEHRREQHQLLVSEGVRFDAADCVSLRAFGWLPVDL